MVKKTKKFKADKVRQKKSQKQPSDGVAAPASSSNPFEVHVNREKHHVLNRKTKHDKGLPGVSRGKAFNRRKKTLLDEYKKVNKTNALVDRRLGEFDPSLTPDDKMSQRLAAERLKQDKRNIYNLDDEIDLTHYGQSLSEVERFQRPEGESGSEDEEVLSKRTIAETHFGGFLTKKGGSGGQEGSENEPRTYKDMMGEVMAKAKDKKHERQVEREGNVELTEKLDGDWKALQGVIAATLKRGTAREDRRPEADDYDRTVRELQFEMKATPTDRLKTDAEIAREEKEKLDELEEERRVRMGDGGGSRKGKHVSADDLQGNYDRGDDDDEFEVKYDSHGRLVEPKKSGEGGLSDTSEDDGETRGGASSTEEDSSDDDDDYSDIESDPGSDKDSVVQIAEVPKPPQENKKKGKKKAPVESGTEIPFVIPIPASYDELRGLFENRSPGEKVLILDRIRKSNHPSLAVGNKDKLIGLVPYLLDFFFDSCAETEIDFGLVDGVTRHIGELTRLSPAKSSAAIAAKLSERHKRFEIVTEKGGGRGAYPHAGLLFFFKLIGNVFPTSDYRHRIVTPAVLFMTTLLSDCSVRNLRDLGAGLFLCTLLLEFETLSRRYVPEVMYFLRGTLALGLGASGNRYLGPPFRKTPPQNGLLMMEAPLKKKTRVEKPALRKMLFCRQPGSLEDNQTKLSLLNLAVELVRKFAEMYRDLPSFVEIYKPFGELLAELRDKNKSILTGAISDCLDAISKSPESPRKFVSLEKKKPKLIRLLDPMIETNFDPTRKSKIGADKETNDQLRLVHKHKREMKGAIREIRRDNQFLAKHRLNEQLEQDHERKRKVKEIYGMLSQQEGDYKAIKRSKMIIPRQSSK